MPGPRCYGGNVPLPSDLTAAAGATRTTLAGGSLLLAAPATIADLMAMSSSADGVKDQLPPELQRSGSIATVVVIMPPGSGSPS